MILPASIFLDFDLPNPTTWFYFSTLLAIALFFKFSRLISIRNLDVLSIFLLVPGMLILLETGGASLWGYVWLCSASALLFFRCLLDLILVQRPALSANMNLGGMAWLSIALLASLIAVAIKHEIKERKREEQPGVVIDQLNKRGESMLYRTIGERAKVGVERALAVMCHFAVALGLLFVGWRHFQDVQAGMGAATFYLLMPFTYLLLPYVHLQVGHWHHVWPMALMVWALVAYPWPFVAGLIMGIAIGSVYFPLLVLPVWCSFYWRRGMARFLLGIGLGALLCGIFVLLVAWISGEGLQRLSDLMPVDLDDWTPWKEPGAETLGLWKGMHWAYRLPIFILYLAFVLLTIIWPHPKNLAHLLALSTAILIGTQFWYADQGGLYVTWYLPFLLLLMFRPNLTNHRPPPRPANGDWLSRTCQACGRWIRRRFGKPAPFVSAGRS